MTRDNTTIRSTSRILDGDHADDEQDPAARRPGHQSEQRSHLDLSLTQVLGGALAAMTAAALGSRLGVAGTLVGAALASIIAGVGGSIYTASLRRGGEKVKTVWSGRTAGTDTPAAVDAIPETDPWDLPQAPLRAQRRARARLPWKAMVAVTVAAFAIAAVAITGLELLSGSAISGGKGTTIEQVRKPHQPVDKPSPQATASESPPASESESQSPAPVPSEQATAGPSEQPSGQAPSPSVPTQQPSQAEPSQQPSRADPGQQRQQSQGPAGDPPSAASGNRTPAG